MPSFFFFPLTILALVTTIANAQAVFAHVIVGNNEAYNVSHWISDIKLAASFGIDAFVLNIAPPLIGTIATQLKIAFHAAEQLGNAFKLFLSFDDLGGEGPWETENIIMLLKQYHNSPAYFHHKGRPLVSTFEGPTNSDVTQWITIRNAIAGGIYFVPDWTSQGPGYRTDLYDGAFSWNMWPDGPQDMTTVPDKAWQRSLQRESKTYMMGISPWFYTNLPAYNKAWVWRGDRLWYDRWQQTLEIRPDFVQIVSWNDFGESHYIGPIFERGIPRAIGADARPYVHGFPHEAWLETLQYQIAAYKHAVNSENPAPVVGLGEDRIVYWYRTTPASSGQHQVTGNHSPSSINIGAYQDPYPVSEILEDRIYAIALLSRPGEVSIAIGNHPAHTFNNLTTGINFVSRPFNGQTGKVTIRSSFGCFGEGREINSKPDGITNFNAWVGCARLPH